MFHRDVQRRFHRGPGPCTTSLCTLIDGSIWEKRPRPVAGCCMLSTVVPLLYPWYTFFPVHFQVPQPPCTFPAFSSYFTQCMIAARACVIPVQSSHRNLTAIRWSCQGTHGIAEPRQTGEPWTAKWTEAAGWKEVDTTSEQNRLWNFQVTHNKTTN